MRKSKSILTLSMLVVLFVLPIFIANWLYHHRMLLPEKTTNHGQLILPPFPVSQLETHGKWTLALLVTQSCDKNCQHRFYYLNQIRKASGKNQNRIQLSLLTKYYPKIPHENGTVFIIDPLGNMMMAYLPHAKPMDIFSDLQHLLSVSQIG